MGYYNCIYPIIKLNSRSTGQLFFVKLMLDNYRLRRAVVSISHVQDVMRIDSWRRHWRGVRHHNLAWIRWQFWWFPKDVL